MKCTLNAADIYTDSWEVLGYNSNNGLCVGLQITTVCCIWMCIIHTMNSISLLGSSWFHEFYSWVVFAWARCSLIYIITTNTTKTTNNTYYQGIIDKLGDEMPLLLHSLLALSESLICENQAWHHHGFNKMLVSNSKIKMKKRKM